MLGHRLGIAVAIAGALALAGCAGEPSTPSMTSAAPTSPPTRIYDSEAEAARAAEAAYLAYQRVADEVGWDGGLEAERYETVATGTALEEGLRSGQQYRENKARAVGETVVTQVTLQSVDLSDPTGAVTVYACVDVSGVDVVDESGQSLVKPDRPPRVLFEVVTRQSDGWLKVAERSIWASEC
ncbi:hypothetical protein [Naasia sp. SYSU D00057]|uniref:hypothetical protein n=1 Tax=Naasia sp. SYSU D00057 TaxID=2817380 RepID=UPI001B3042DC|nr:hypothetical protein [Naasia sp. SYSU D00057]